MHWPPSPLKIISKVARKVKDKRKNIYIVSSYHILHPALGQLQPSLLRPLFLRPRVADPEFDHISILDLHWSDQPIQSLGNKGQSSQTIVLYLGVKNPKQLSQQLLCLSFLRVWKQQIKKISKIHPRGVAIRTKVAAVYGVKNNQS